MKNIEPDIFADVRFFATNEGGREHTLRAEIYKPKLQLEDEDEGHVHFCGLLIDGFGEIIPGQFLKDVPIKFLYPEQLVKKLRAGTPFRLREGRYVAKGVVTEETGEEKKRGQPPLVS